jgi:DNA-binding SARP family transcriptional activator
VIDEKRPRTYIYLLGEFLAELYREDGTQRAVAKQVWAMTYARRLLKYLLSVKGRRAAISDLIDAFWPDDGREEIEQEEESREKRREKYLDDAMTKLRQVFGKDIIKKGGGSFELAGPEVLQTDIEECKQLLMKAEQFGFLSADGIGFLERASRRFKRGRMLSGEDGQWSEGFRAEQEEAMQYCLLKLAAGYEAQKRLMCAREQYLWLLEINPLDEDALRSYLCMLHRHGLVETFRSTYEQAQKRFQKYEMRLSATTKELVKKLIQEPAPLDLYLIPPVLSSPAKESEAPQQSDTLLAQPSPITYNVSSQLSSPPRLELPEMLMIQRRKFLYDLLNVAGSSVIASPYALLSGEDGERLERLMAHTSYVDDKAINALASTTQNFWDLRQNIAPINLLNVVAEHLTTVTQLLRDARPTAITQSLCALASENAQLLGRIFDEIGEFDLAWKSSAFALNMAQEIHHNDLWAASAVRLAELLWEWGEPRQGLLFLEEAHKRGISDQRLRVWLSSAEAQIHARTGNMDAFLRALKLSKDITLPISLADDIYRTRFNPRMVAGYEAAGFIWLREPERALQLLKERNPISTREHSLHLGNLGRVYGQLGDVTKACGLLLESLGITKQTKSLNALQRVYQGRAELEPWKNSGEVKELDARIVEVYQSLAKVRERVW